MPIPNLIHPVSVTVERVVAAAVRQDLEAGEPVHGPPSTSIPVVIEAQCKWRTAEEPTAKDGGWRETDAGYITVRTMDMDAHAGLGVGVRFSRNDKITAVGHRTGLVLFIARSQPIGQYEDAFGGHTLYRYYFEDRQPTRQ